MEQKNSLYRSLTFVAAGTIILLMVPLVAMIFTNEVDWSFMDFVVAGILLFGTGSSFIVLARRSNKFVYKAGAAITVGTLLLLLWSNLAVGIIGSEDNPLNLLYLIILGILFFGSILVKFQPRKMSQLLLLTALVQLFIIFAALAVERNNPAIKPIEIIAFNSVFIVMWCGASLLFRQTHSHQAKENS